MPDVISPSPNEVLQALLNAHGYDTRLSLGRVVVIGHQAQWSGEVYFQSEHDPAHLQLDVNIHLPDGRTLTESFSGLTHELKFALGDAFDNFSRASFHVLLQAFFSTSAEVQGELWQLPTGAFTAFIGDVTFRGQPPVAGEELVAFAEPFFGAIQRARLSPRQSHWCRLYYAQHEGRMSVCEALLDNEPWEPMQRFMARYNWPRSKAFYSARLFLVLLPD